MCGIVGFAGINDVPLKLFEGLKKLEYRGYDSAGISFFDNNKKLITIKSVGATENLKNLIDGYSAKTDTKNCTVGIGHTRWATHGKASDVNSHPHLSEQKIVTIVHNGIIENYLDLKKTYLSNTKFLSKTDTEVVANLLEKNFLETHNELIAIKQTMNMLKGSYAFAIMFNEKPNNIYFAKRISPLLIGIGNNKNCLSSDILGFCNSASKFIDIKDNWLGYINKSEIHIFDKKLKEMSVEPKSLSVNQMNVDLNGYPHFMLKEICEIKSAIVNTASLYLSDNSPLMNIFNKKIDCMSKNMHLAKKFDIFENIKRVHLIACGTSYHASTIGEKWLREIGLDATSNIASEFIYTKQAIDKNTLCIFVSQSGETADTLTSIKLAKKMKAKTLGITNVETSSITKLCDIIMPIKCGQEIAVASTKAYNGQLCALFILAEFLKQYKKMDKIIIDKNIKKLEIVQNFKKIWQKNVKKLQNIANFIDISQFEDEINPFVKYVLNARNIFMVGKNYDYSLAMESALKLKEITYISAEAYASGELKHGTISLVDNNTLVFAFATQTKLIDKTMNIIKQTESRGAKTIIVTPFKIESKNVIRLPKINEKFYPIISIIPMQLLAYKVSTTLGNNPDKPRNLAKSVTVE